MSEPQSVWLSDEPTPKSAPFAGDAAADVCVIGGGIAGMSVAYRLQELGRSALVLDAREPGGGETAFTTAHLTWELDDRFARLADLRGDEVAKAAAASHRQAIDDIERVARTENFDCDFVRVDGYLFPGLDGPKTLEEEREAVRRLGLEHEEVASVPLARRPGLRFPGHARFHPVKYMNGLVAAVRRRGGKVHGGTRVVKIDGGDECRVELENGSAVTAKAVVVATNAPFDAGLTLHLRLAAYTTYALALPVPAGEVLVHDALYWDTEDPYHYARLIPAAGRDSALLVVGGEDHKTGQASDQDERWDRLAEWGRGLVPAAGEPAYRWSGQVFETADGLGLIGAAPWGKNVYVITGDSGMGLTHATLGGRLVADLIAGRENQLAAVYDPGRWTPSAAFDLMKENANVAAQYADWVTGGEVSSLDQIPPGHGAIIRRGLQKVAVHRREDGTVCERSATCPHLKAVVRWNPGEKTWDCPAHGSRFAPDGNVLHGPAVSGLEELK